VAATAMVVTIEDDMICCLHS